MARKSKGGGGIPVFLIATLMLSIGVSYLLLFTSVGTDVAGILQDYNISPTTVTETTITGSGDISQLDPEVCRQAGLTGCPEP